METQYYDLCKKVYSGMGELAKESPELMKGIVMYKTFGGLRK